MANERYLVMYDYYDPEFGTTTLKEKAQNYEEAEEISEGLKANDNYSNIEIVDLYREQE